MQFGKLDHEEVENIKSRVKQSVWQAEKTKAAIHPKIQVTDTCRQNSKENMWNMAIHKESVSLSTTVVEKM